MYKYLRLLLLAIILFSFNYSNASKVNIEDAKKIAVKFYIERQQPLYLGEVGINSVEIYKYKGIETAFIFEMIPEGFVIVSPESNTIPVLGYSLKSNIDEKPTSFKFWMDNYSQQIVKVIKENLPANNEIKNLWDKYLKTDYKHLKPFKSKSVEPLLLSNWNQNAKYNQFCPLDSNGPGNRAYAGCVATAMSQHMYYFKFPKTGNSSHTYYSNYGYLTADFGNTNYNYDEMIPKIVSRYNPALAELMYHCGISVDMNYTASGSGAQMWQAALSMQQYFNYSTSIDYRQKSNYTDNQWTNEIINSLDNGIPIMYAGYPQGGGAGHAFNLDGYQGSNYFHFNWGWSGSYDGYFYLTAINPGSSDFTAGQIGIFDAVPPSSANYPDYCVSTKTITTNEGSFDDGSGPLYNYQNSTDCKWLIQPSAPVEYVKLSVDYYKISDTNDLLILYDGSTINDPVIDTISPNNLSNYFLSTGQSMLVRFISDNQLNDKGWHLSYSSKDLKFCSGSQNLTSISDTFSDGSGNDDYMNSSFCSWYISPEGNPGEIRLSFLDLNTESNHDFVKIYDPTTLPSTLVAEFSGDNIPQDVCTFNGSMLVQFFTNDNTKDEGWEVYYISGPVGFEDYNYDNVEIYPNPANSYVNITGMKSGYKNVISVYDINSALVNKINTNNAAYKLKVSDLSKGVYFIKLNNNLAEKLIVL